MCLYMGIFSRAPKAYQVSFGAHGSLEAGSSFPLFYKAEG